MPIRDARGKFVKAPEPELAQFLPEQPLAETSHPAIGHWAVAVFILVVVACLLYATAMLRMVR